MSISNLDEEEARRYKYKSYNDERDRNRETDRQTDMCCLDCIDNDGWVGGLIDACSSARPHPAYLYFV